MKNFNIPEFYKSPVITGIKKKRNADDPRKKDYKPTIIKNENVVFIITRHFGFCYGVENAIEISYEAIENNPDKRIFLLSEMIHNPEVNKDLLSRGVRFINKTDGTQLIPWDDIKQSDVIIIPAFGTTLETKREIEERGLSTYKYDTTCPFVEKVWNRAASLGRDNCTVIVHGKYKHEETKATFSHSKEAAPTIVIRNIEEAQKLGNIILGKINTDEFYKIFPGRYSDGFTPEKHLKKIGVVNQTTMLAGETQGIANLLRKAMIEKFGLENINEHFADTRDTLCYATHDNQRSTIELLNYEADLAIVVGGYNSSNTSHLVELCESRFRTYFISSPSKINSKDKITHYDLKSGAEIQTTPFLPEHRPVRIAITSGASCPDSIVEGIINKMESILK